MKVLNIHKRSINQPKNVIVDHLKTLATEQDRIWAKRNTGLLSDLKIGLKMGAKGDTDPFDT
ncbi:MAG: hypothetical protein IPN46_16975 [Saprospiraceae bacterium]|nr:hypothetical protein [Saprospiraceae bacterium]